MLDFLKLLVYTAPIRQDITLPYNPYEYKKYKDEVYTYVNQSKAYYRNYEDIIEPKFWGYKNSTNLTKGKEIDFMHFQSKGHKILADTLINDIEKIILDNN